MIASQKGDTAYRSGDLRAAIGYYQSAKRKDPAKAAEYDRKLVRIEFELNVLNQAGAAQKDQREAEAKGKPTPYVYDTPKTPVPVVLAVHVSQGDPAAALAEKLGIRLDLNDPKNYEALDALHKIVDALRFNERASASEWTPDVAGFGKGVTDLNRILRDLGQPEVKKETVERVSFRLFFPEGTTASGQR
jgi:hypothetical protein